MPTKSLAVAAPQLRSPLFMFALLAVYLATPSAAQASGISLAKYGGIHGHPNADGALTVYWNPARLSLSEGFLLSVDATGIRRVASYDRTNALEDFSFYYRSEDPARLEEFLNDPDLISDYELANTGRATTGTMAVLPYLALGYATPLADNKFRLGVGFSIFPAFGGGSTWDKNLNAPSHLPGAVDGPQRWAAISSNLMVLHYLGAVSFALPDYGLSFGFSASYVTSEIETTRARNANRSDALYSPSGQLEEGRVYFIGNDSTVAFAAAASLDIANVRASAVYRFGHSVRMSGPLDIAFSVSEPRRTNAYVDFSYPSVFLTALSVDFSPLTLTAVSDFTQWSVIKDNDVKTITPEGDVERLLVIPREMLNTFSVRGIAEWRFNDAIEISGMLGWDPTAVPTETLDPGLSDANKIQVGIGARWSFNDSISLNTSLLHDFFMVARSTDTHHQPSLNGTYRDSRSYLNLSLDARF